MSALYVIEGSLNAGGTLLSQYTMAVFTSETDIKVTAEEDCLLSLIGGKPLGKRYMEWNFISSRKARVEQAKIDWENGNFPLVCGDEDEFIPLPK